VRQVEADLSEAKELGGGRSETEIKSRQRWSNPLVWRCNGSGLREREGP
jgi:hypothetical protein